MYSKIRDARNNMNLSLGELSAMTGIGSSYLSKIELGKTNPSIGTLDKICKVLKLKIVIEA